MKVLEVLMHRAWKRFSRVTSFAALTLAIACGGAVESDLFATEGSSTGSDASTSGQDSNSSGNDGGPKKDAPGPVKAPIEIAQLDVGQGDKGRIGYAVKLRNVSTLEMDQLNSIELSFAGGGGTIFQINCNGKDWRVPPGATDAVPNFSTFNLVTQTELFFECNGNKDSLPAAAIQKYGQQPVTVKLSGTMKDGTEWFASASRGF